MTRDFFQLLGIAARFEIDVADITRRLRRESARRHPDRAPDPVTAAAWTADLARLNEAARVLSDDLERAELLVELRGGPGPGEDRTLPDGFLESTLEIRMALEEAVATGDEAARRSIENWGRDAWHARRAAVAALLDGPNGEEPQVLGEVRRELNCWRYAQRMLEQLDPAGEG